MDHYSGARCSNRVAHCNCSALCIYFVRFYPQFSGGVDHDSSEGFINLDNVEVFNLPLLPIQCCFKSISRLRLQRTIWTCNLSGGAQRRQRNPSVFLSLCTCRQHYSCCTI